jgi:hypothetical protein
LALTGSKGSPSYIKNILVYLGGIDLYDYVHREKFSIFYKRNDIDPTCKGLILNSFSNGLSAK